MLEAASSLDHLLLLPFQRDTYPDREFHSPLPRALQRILLTSSGLVGQDMRHLDKIGLLRRLADSGDLSFDREDATLLEEPYLTIGQSHQFSGSANLRKSHNFSMLCLAFCFW